MNNTTLRVTSGLRDAIQRGRPRIATGRFLPHRGFFDREDFYHHGEKSCIIAYMLGRYAGCLPSSLTLLLLMAAGVLPSQAQSTALPSETLALERSVLAESFASARLWVWQKRLNLQGWDVSVVVSRADGLKPKTVGNIHWDRD